MGIVSLNKWFGYHKARVYTRLLRSDFGGIGKGSLVHPPFHTNDASKVFIGENCQVWSYGWIDCVSSYAGVSYSPRIDIGDGSYIGYRCHIIACSHMTIGRHVVIADGVYISDNLHGYEDVSVPVLDQPLVSPGPVTIEDEVWIGEGVSVLPNVTIGRHSIIGAGSVVSRSIPEYCVAVGSPARVIKKYNHDTKCWEKVNHQ